MQRASSRPDFVIKGGQQSAESLLKTSRTNKISTSRFTVDGRQKSQTERASLEQTIFGLQERCIKTAEGIEMQAEKEAFYDQEIIRLNKLIETTRLKKIKKKEGNEQNKVHTLSTKEGFLGKGTEESIMKPSYLKSKISHVNSSINETKAKNKQLREVLNDLR